MGTNPVAAISTLDFIGLPLDDADRYGEILHRSVFTDRESPEFAEVAQGLEWLVGDMYQQVVVRRADLGDDMLSTLIQSEVNGEALDDALVAELLFMLLNGGIDTSTGLISHALLYLQDHADQRSLLGAEPGRIPAAIEELTRFFTPNTGMARNVTEDVQVGETTLYPGDRVLLAWGSANRDASVFDDPDTVVLDRNPNPHLGFGHGAHKCVGIHFARVSGRVLLEEVLRRLPDLWIDRAATRPYTDTGIINVFAEMPATFSPAHREGRQR